MLPVEISIVQHVRPQKFPENSKTFQESENIVASISFPRLTKFLYAFFLSQPNLNYNITMATGKSKTTFRVKLLHKRLDAGL